MTTPVSGLINDLDKAIKTKSSQSAWLVIAMDYPLVFKFCSDNI